MSRTWKWLCLPTLLVVALSVAPVRADPEFPNKTDQKLDLILNQLKEMKASSAAQKELYDLEIAVLKRRITELEGALDRMTKERVSNYPTTPNGPTAEEIRQLREVIDQLKRTRISSSFTPSDTVTPPASGMVRIQNLSARTSVVAVNGVTYTVRPGETAVTNAPSGTFTYEVMLDGRGFRHLPQVRALPGNEVFTIYINP